jgi:hypothetical protein
MEFNMAGKAIMRAFLILALIVTAHLIRPFSIKNVTQHLLYSSRSFSFVLPAQLREKFDKANNLAINLSNGLFEADEGIRDFMREMAPDLAFMPINAQPLDEVNKSATKQKSCSKKSSPAKRSKATEKRGAADQQALANLVAIARSSDIRPGELPPAQMIEATVVPIVPPRLTKTFPTRIPAIAPIRAIEATFMLRKRECESRAPGQKPRIALIEGDAKAKGPIWVVEKAGVRKIALGVPECEDQGTAITAEEVEVEIIRADSVAPRAAEESKPNPLSTPFAKCN